MRKREDSIGNICRSPMAEFIMKHLVKQAGLDWQIASAATTTEELGNDIYPNAKAELKRHGIPFEHRRARQIRSNEDWDLIIAMDHENLNDIRSIYPEKKVKLLMSFAGEEKSVFASSTFTCILSPSSFGLTSYSKRY